MTPRHNNLADLFIQECLEAIKPEMQRVFKLTFLLFLFVSVLLMLSKPDKLLLGPLYDMLSFRPLEFFLALGMAIISFTSLFPSAFQRLEAHGKAIIKKALAGSGVLFGVMLAFLITGNALNLIKTHDVLWIFAQASAYAILLVVYSAFGFGFAEASETLKKKLHKCWYFLSLTFWLFVLLFIFI